ncbi:Ig-like domain-containing protein, partial [Edaphovirga cremea]|uniref:Ig-like domain-containing protein n=1 Tax=Edaphovirga cremea TaxID=2267246 RepID=UPI003988BAC0
MNKLVDVISRKTAVKTAFASDSKLLSVSLHEPSVILVHASAQNVARYERAGNDLLIYMKDGSVIRCNDYFVEDSEKRHGELVFQDDASQALTHVEFTDTGATLGVQTVILHPTETALVNLEPLMIGSSSDIPWGLLAAGVLGAGALGAAAGHSSKGETETRVIDNTRDVEITNPTFLVIDNQGDSRGVLSANAITDDTQPTFSGTGLAGSSIQIKDANGIVIASAQVGNEGTWTVQIPAQTDGSHTYSVVQISGDKVTSAGDITLNITSAQATLSVEPPANDNILRTSIVVSGSSTSLDPGTEITVTLNGKDYPTTVGENGAWEVTVTAMDAAELADGVHTITVTGRDATGNLITGTNTLSIDTHAPVLSIDPVSSDDMINAAESGQALVVSGRTDAEAGQQVTMTLNGQQYTSIVDADGRWSTTVPATDVARLTEGNNTLSARVSDAAGNPSWVERSVLVDITVPAITIHTVAGDNVLNASEHMQAQVISGGSSGAAGDILTLTVAGQTYTTTVNAAGNWSVGVPASVINGLENGSVTLVASLTDKAGNTGSATHDITVNTTSLQLSIDTLAQDDVINAVEKSCDLLLSGGSNLADGTIVIVSLNGKNYTTEVNGGLWSLTVPAADVAQLGEAHYTVTAMATDGLGNSVSVDHQVLVDSAIPTVSIQAVTSDDILNLAEVGVNQSISGRVTGAAAGDTVTLNLGGISYTTQVNADLSWSVTVPAADLTALGDGGLTFSASVTNGHGNTGHGSRDITVDADLPGLRIDTVAGDDIINAIEHQQNLIVSGTSSGLTPGAQLVISVNGQSYSASVLPDGTWLTLVPIADVTNWPAGAVDITVAGQSSAGNPVEMTHPVTVDLTTVAVSINAVATDNVINAVEKGQDLVLSGSTQNVETGQIVKVSFGGQIYDATVDVDGNWAVTVLSADLMNVTDGDTRVQVSVVNAAGNSASAAQNVHVDSVAPVLSIDPITSDNIINAAEAGTHLTVTGTCNAEVGQRIIVTLDGKTYEATAGADGTWSATIARSDLGALADGNYTISASVVDKAGNPASANRDALLDTQAPTVAINVIAGDDIINSTEHGLAQIVTGSSTGAVPGDSVVLTINGHNYSTTVDTSGNWSVGVPASVISALNDGTTTVSVTITDKAGNAGSATKDVTVNTVAPTLTIGDIAVDNVLNAVEKGQSLEISGTSNLANDTVVTVNLNGINYTATVSGGAWSVEVPVADLAKLGEANYTVTASATNGIGNSISDTHNLLVDTALPSVIFNPITSDDVLSMAEISSDYTLTGRVTGAASGDTVTINLGGKPYSATVQADLSWSVSVPSADLIALGNGALSVTASVTNVHGNTGTGSRDFMVDADLPGLRVATVAGDDIINAIEHNQSVNISGTSSGLTPGAQLTISVNGQSYSASVLPDGTWLTSVPAADVTQWPAGPVNITVTGQSTAGNPVEIGHTVTVDLTTVAVSINTVAGDNVLNAAEKGQDLVLSGSTQNVEAGQVVKVSFGGHTYDATVDASGNWAVTVPAADMANVNDGDTNVQVSVVNQAGNSASAAQNVHVDITAPTLITDPIAGDNVINAAEAGADLTITGTSNAEAGQTVTVNVNGTDYSATVGTNGTWSATVPQASLAGLTDGPLSVTANVADKAGNSSDASKDVTVDLTAPTVIISTIANDNVINSSEHALAQIINGTSTGSVGDKVAVTIDGHTYTTTLDASGNWSVGVPASVISALNDGTTTVSATITDTAGNVGNATKNITVNTVAPTLTIDTLAGDDVLNATEKGSPLEICGTTNLADNTTVIVNLNGKNYTTTANDGEWSISVSVEDLATLGAASYTVTASATDSVGNSVSANHGFLVDGLLPGIIINPITSDNILNLAELSAGQTLGGKVIGAAEGDTVTFNLGGKTYTTTVQSDLTWSVSVPSADLIALGNGALSVTASVTNVHGNTGTGSRDFMVDANLPGLRVATVAGDDVVNAIEHNQSVNISGTSNGLTPGAQLTISVNGQTYNASVLPDGSWLTNVPASDVTHWPAGPVNITVAGQSTAGNPVEIGHTVAVDLSSVAVSINTVAGDNVLNAAEKGQDLVLSGSSQNVEADQVVKVSFAGHSYDATVNASGNWTVTVPAADMANVKDGDTNVQVSVANQAGNSASAAQNVHVDITAPTLSIDPIAGDNVINVAEAGAELNITGTSNVEAGQNVTVNVNGTDYSATVGTDGTWSVTVPAADMAALTDGDITVTAGVNDKAGNPASADKGVLVDLIAPTVTINTIAGDDIINSSELLQAQIVTGSSSGAVAGDSVVLTIDGHTYTTTVDASGNWSVGVPASVIGALTDGTSTVSATLTDKAGNAGSATKDVTVNTVTPTLTIGDIAVDNVLNAIEKGQPLSISGTTNLANDTVVTVNLNGINYTTTVSGGAWSVEVPVADLATLGEANYTVTASATNGIGNSISDTHNLLVDTALPSTIINPVTSDNVLNLAEISSGQTLSGKVAGAAAGDTVTVLLGGKAYTTTVLGDLTWSIPVSAADLTALGNGALSVTASVTNVHGNTGGGSRDFMVDANLPGLRVATVAGDDIINAIEHNQSVMIGGSSSGMAPGTALIISVNGQTYNASVLADGTWLTSVPAADVSHWPAGPVNITVAGQSSVGNPVEIGHTVAVDLSSVAVSINTVASDNVLNAAEKGQDLVLSGSSQNVEAGQVVKVSFAAHSYDATVDASGNWTVTVPAADMANVKDGDTHVQVSVVNQAGNSASAAQNVHVDITAPTLSIEPIASDNMINAAEAGADLTITGTSNAETGQTVTVNVNGTDYSATVGSDGTWSATVPAADMAVLTDGDITVTASVSDKAGNLTSADKGVLVDLTAPTMTIDTIASDNVINLSEHAQAQIVSGTSTGAVGDKVAVTIDGHTYLTTVDASGNWSVGVPANAIAALIDGTVTVGVSITDVAGNTGSISKNITVDTGLPGLSFRPIAVDNVLNAVEKGEPLVISGDSSHLSNGSTVTVNLNGKNYTSTVDADGSWSVSVPILDLNKLGQADYTVTVSGTSDIGNSVSRTANLLVDTALPTVAINPITSDDLLNLAEVSSGQTLTGSVNGAAAGDTVTLNLGGKEFTTTVQSDLTWSISVTSAELQALGNGALSVTASVTNTHGNTGTGSRDFMVDANLPGLRVATVAGDDIINAIEHDQSVNIGGTSSGMTPGAALVVTVNGQTYNASVLADGSWLTNVPAADVTHWPAGPVNITVTGQSTAGNPVEIGHTVAVDLTTVAVSINTVAGDNVLNAAEKGQDLVLSGSSQNVEAGQVVKVSFAGHSYNASVDASGNWTVTVPAANMGGVNDGDTNVQVSVINQAGNSASAAQNVHVDITAPTLTIDAITHDNIINAAEAGDDLVISGTSSAQVGQTVTLNFNGTDYSATVGSNGTWSVNVPSADLSTLTEGTHIVSASVSDKAGNPASTDKSVLVDLTAPTVTIDLIAGDDILNSSELLQAQIVTGTSSGAVGDSVVLTIDGHSYTTTLDASGNWSVGVPASVISALTDGTSTVSVTITDKAGNAGSATKDVTVNTVAPTLTIGDIAVDNVLNAIEKGQPLAISGTSNLADDTVVTVNLNGINYTATVSGGAWSVNVPVADLATLGEASYTVTASATNGIGNNINAIHNLLVDTALPSVIFNPITSDNILNLAEVSSGQTLTGRVTGAASGDTVTLNLGGKSYSATVQADLSWSIPVSATDLTALGNGALSVTASVTNVHGNTGTGSRDFMVDADLPGLRVATVAGDDIINAIEHNQSVNISGTSSGMTPGAALVVTVNGQTYNASVLADGTWLTSVPAADVINWPAGPVNITVAGQSTAGNPVEIGHTVAVDLSSVAVSINTVAGDNVLNAAEKGQDLVLSGSTQNVEAGQTVKVSFGGHTYDATVDASGNWTVTVPAADMATVNDGDTHVRVSVVNQAGNSASAAQNVHVDLTAPTLIIDPIAGDNIINAAEAGAAVTVSGSSNAEAGQNVTVNVNGVEYTATVGTDGKWSVDVAAGGLTDGVTSVTASVSDKAGNPASADKSVLVDLSAPTVTIDLIAGDDILNSSELLQAQIVTGTSSGTVGDSVVLTIDGHSYTTTLDASGNWSVGVPTSVISALTEGTSTVSVTITDKAGNAGSATKDITVSTAVPSLTIGDIAVDNVLNAIEKGQPLAISGTSNLANDTVVTVNLNGINYTTTVSGGTWSVEVPVADLATLGEASYTVTASATNGIGNNINVTHNLLVDTALPSVIFNPITSDNILNLAEVSSGQTLTGRVTGAASGDTVTINLGGKSYSATVQADLSWSIPVSATDLTALGNGALSVTGSVTNVHGNTGTGSRDFMVDANLPGLRVATVAGDDIINAIEHNQSVNISGTSSGMTPGAALVVTVNGLTYNASVLADGTWLTSVPAADVTHWPAGPVNITVTGQSTAGNPVEIGHTVAVDLSSVAVSINTVAGDNVLNAAEKGQDLVLSGSSQNVEAGQVVKVSFAGHSYNATVDASGNWAVTVPAADMNGVNNGDTNVQVSVVNQAGNSASAAQNVHVDLTAPTLIIDPIAGDNIINAAEAGAAVTVSGSSNAEAGQNVNVNVNGVEYTASVGTDGKWSVDVAAGGLTDGVTSVTASVSDKAGNPASADKSVLVDLSAPVITINPVAGDDVINSSEHTQAQIINGTSTGAATGDLVTVTINDQPYTTTVDASGNWSVGVPSAIINGLADNTYTITATITDKAGNVATGTRDVTVNTVSPTLTINQIASDDVLNDGEKATMMPITGSSTGLAADTLVVVNLNGVNYSTIVDASGNWTVNVPVNDLLNLTNAFYQVTVSATDANGNSNSETRTLTVDTLLPAVVINPVTSDDILNLAEISVDQTISGHVTNALPGAEVNVTLGGNTYTTLVQSDLTWSLNVPSADMIAMGDGALTVTASVTNNLGNTGTNVRDISIDANSPGLRIATVAGDDIINVIEHNQNLIITGTSTGMAPGVQLTISVNGQTYNASVLADGTWLTNVPAVDVASWPAGAVNITVAGSSATGNPVQIGHTVTVDLTTVAVSINTVAGDNVLNAAEKGQDLVLSGSTQNVEADQVVKVSFAGHTYDASVDASGNWTVTVPAADMNGVNNGDTHVQVSVVNQAGNSASAAQNVHVDLTAPSLTIDPVTSDNMINASEAGAALTVSGSSNAEAGQSVTVNVNGDNYTTTVGTDGKWSVEVTPNGLTDGTINVTASVSDKAGNPTSTT